MACDSALEDSFLSQVERVRGEMRTKFSRAHQMLQQREDALLSDLDQLVSEYRGEGLSKQIQQVKFTKEELMTNLKGNENQETLQNCVAPLDARIRQLETMLETAKDRLRSVVLEWDTDLESRLNEIGGIRIQGELDYTKKGNPVMVACKYSSDTSTVAGVFSGQQSIAIDSQTNNVYICDCFNNRIQVFSKSIEFLFEFSKEMNEPSGICISQNKVYVTQYSGNCVNVYTTEGKLLRSAGRKGNNELEFDGPRRLAVSAEKSLIYICDNYNDRIDCLDLDLTFNSFIPDIFAPRDVKLTKKEILVLKGGYYCICIFNYSHQFICEMIRCGDGSNLMRPLFFCLDQENNFLLTDWLASCVVIFSSRGELIHKFGKVGERRGEFIDPTGIAVDSDSRIIVCSDNPNNCIQLF